jgi:hypothetical protein
VSTASIRALDSSTALPGRRRKEEMGVSSSNRAKGGGGKVLERKENGSKRSFPFRCFETKMVYE